MYNLNINKHIKNSVITTPQDLAEFIYKKVARKPYKNILDIGCYSGSLSKPFRRKNNTKIIGIDIQNNFQEEFDEFIYKDFLETTKKDFPDIDLILCNPPFNDLLSFKFLEHSQKLFGDIPKIFIFPEYILNNSKTRALELEKYDITKIVKLNQNTFNGVAIHSSVVFFNINFKSKKIFEYYYPKSKITGKTRTIYFTQEQEEYLQKTLKVKNFTRYIKELIKRDSQDFPF